jgi:hypothetical protein
MYFFFYLPQFNIRVRAGAASRYGSGPTNTLCTQRIAHGQWFAFFYPIKLITLVLFGVFQYFPGFSSKGIVSRDFEVCFLQLYELRRVSEFGLQLTRRSSLLMM